VSLTSQTFTLLFLPGALIAFFSLGRFPRYAMAVLVTASLLFYALSDAGAFPLLLLSIFFNYLLGRRLTGDRAAALLGAGILVNLSVLAFFKYSGPLTAWAVFAPGGLPLGISFFTFTQIAFLVDVHRGREWAKLSDHSPLAAHLTLA